MLITENEIDDIHTINFNFETPLFTGSDTDTAEIELHVLEVIGPGSPTTKVWLNSDIKTTFNFKQITLKGKDSSDTLVRDFERIYTAENNTSGNSKSSTIEIKFGDVESPHRRD